MTDLSPAAQAVLTAVCDNTEPVCDTQHPIAAALRAAVDQVVPKTAKPDDTFCCPPVETIVWKNLMDRRQQLLAIADELEGQQ